MKIPASVCNNKFSYSIAITDNVHLFAVIITLIRASFRCNYETNTWTVPTFTVNKNASFKLLSSVSSMEYKAIRVKLSKIVTSLKYLMECLRCHS